MYNDTTHLLLGATCTATNKVVGYRVSRKGCVGRRAAQGGSPHLCQVAEPSGRHPGDNHISAEAQLGRQARLAARQQLAADSEALHGSRLCSARLGCSETIWCISQITLAQAGPKWRQPKCNPILLCCGVSG